MRVVLLAFLLHFLVVFGASRVSSKGASLQARSSTKRSSTAGRHRESRRRKTGDDDDDDDDDEEGEGEEGDKSSIGFKEDDENSEGARDEEGKKGSGGDEDEGDEDEEDEEEEDNEEGTSEFSRSRSKKKKGALGRGVESATEFANMALKLTKGSVKAAVDLCANKHVTMNQIVGKWRIQQEIEVRKGVFISSPATIEFCDDGSVLTTCDGQEFKSEFTFKERAWPRKCTISFQARAFQGPRDPEPVAMFYKGYFKRSILNPNVVLIRGKVFRLSGKLFFKRQEVCGKFKAQKRRYSK